MVVEINIKKVRLCEEFISVSSQGWLDPSGNAE